MAKEDIGFVIMGLGQKKEPLYKALLKFNQES
jgi:hypothetical protein